MVGKGREDESDCVGNEREIDVEALLESNDEVDRDVEAVPDHLISEFEMVGVCESLDAIDGDALVEAGLIRRNETFVVSATRIPQMPELRQYHFRPVGVLNVV